MFINNEDLREILVCMRDNKPLEPWYINSMLSKVDRADEREQARIQRKRDEQIALCRKIHVLLAEQPERRLCPTDLQFMVYNRFGQQLSCAKVARLCNTMSWYKPIWLPSDLCDVKAQRIHENKPGDNHAYFYI